MSSSDEDAERSTALVHVAKSLLPTEKLAPWMTVLNNRMCVLTATMSTIADLGDELERRSFMDEQEEKNGKNHSTFGSAMETMESPNAPETDHEEAEEFDIDKRRGALTILSKFNRSFVTNLYNVMPSEKGLRAKQAIHFGSAQKTGVAVEPKPRSRWEKLTGKGKERGQIAGVE